MNIIKTAAAYATMVLLGLTMSLVLMNWASGCGQVFYYPDGTWRTGECVLIPHESKRGTWQ